LQAFCGAISDVRSQAMMDMADSSCRAVDMH
jgi:hypothetical protein